MEGVDDAERLMDELPERELYHGQGGQRKHTHCCCDNQRVILESTFDLNSLLYMSNNVCRDTPTLCKVL